MNVYDYNDFEAIKNSFPVNKDISIADALNWYLSGSTLAEKNRKHYISIAKRFIIPLCGTTKARDFSYLDFEVLLGDLYEETSSSIRSRIATLLSSTFNLLQYYELIDHNCIKLYKRPKKCIRAFDPLKNNEIQEFLYFLDGHKYRVIFYFLLFLPIRIQEIFNLRYCEWDENTASICINERTVFLPQKLEIELKNYSLSQKGIHHDYIFTDKHGNPLSTDILNRSLKSISQKMTGHPRITTSRLHDTAIFLINQSGADIKSIQHILGYKSAKGFLRRIKKSGEIHTKLDMNNLFNPHMQSILNTVKELESDAYTDK